MRRRLVGWAVLAAAVVLILLAAAGLVRISGTYAFFSDSETADVSITVATYFGPVPATVDIDPNTLNPHSQGNFVMAYIELPEGFSVGDIVLSTVTLGVVGVEGSVPAKAHPSQVGDHDEDGMPDLMVKFDRPVVIALIGGRSGEVTFRVTGQLSSGEGFEGFDVVRVLGFATPTPAVVALPPSPTATFTPTPTWTPTATPTLEPTSTTEPAAPPAPTPTPTSIAALEPTATPESASTPEATGEPTPTPTPTVEPITTAAPEG
jgi:predicted ribosomally synthesized peptide with SipW-like signal peptide